MYNKYKYLLFSIFIMSFVGFCLFFIWAFNRQHEDYINAQCHQMLEKQNTIVKQIEAMVERDNDWKKEKEFYKNFLKDSVEAIDRDENIYATLYDEKLNVVSEKFSDTEMWASNPMIVSEIVEQCRCNNNGEGFVYYDKLSKYNIKRKDLQSNQKTVYYCYTWIPSLCGNPKFLIVMVLTPSQLAYTNYIFTYGAIALLSVYAILFLGFIYVLKVVNLRGSNKKIENDRRG